MKVSDWFATLDMRTQKTIAMHVLEHRDEHWDPKMREAIGEFSRRLDDEYHRNKKAYEARCAG